MAAKVKSYTVRYEWDAAGGWVITVPKVPGVVTEAETLEEGERLVRDALSLFVDDADTAVLKRLVVMPGRLRRRLEKLEELRRMARSSRRSVGSWRPICSG
jgi:predicted RNase H-like HicB family nuclease